jgi:TolB-like protein
MRRTQAIFAFVSWGCLAIAGQEVARAQEGSADPGYRIWKTQSGGYTTKATLLKFEDGVVQLEKQDGKVVSLPIEKLSNADQEYVKNRSGGGRTAQDTLQPEARSGDETSELEVKCQRLCEYLTKGYKGKDVGGKATIAVVEFSDLAGGVTEFGRLLSEELITKLFATGRYKVVERLLLNKAIAEHNLQLQGLIDPKSAKELGKILGVDAIVSGTIADQGDSLRVNARLISTETAEVLSVAAVTIIKDDAVTKLLKQQGRQDTVAGTEQTSAPPTERQPVQLPFHEDFSGYEDGKETAWGPGGKVRIGADGRRWLMASESGQKTVGRDVRLPDNAYLEIDYDARKLESREGTEKVLSCISLVDETGAKYRIDLAIEVHSNDFAKVAITLPGGAGFSESYVHGKANTNTLIMKKMGDSISLRLKDIEPFWMRDLTGNLSDFKKFVRVELELYKGANSLIAFTNVNIGSLGGPRGAAPGLGTNRRSRGHR